MRSQPTLLNFGVCPSRIRAESFSVVRVPPCGDQADNWCVLEDIDAYNAACTEAGVELEPWQFTRVVLTGFDNAMFSARSSGPTPLGAGDAAAPSVASASASAGAGGPGGGAAAVMLSSARASAVVPPESLVVQDNLFALGRMLDDMLLRSGSAGLVRAGLVARAQAPSRGFGHVVVRMHVPVWLSSPWLRFCVWAGERLGHAVVDILSGACAELAR